MRSLRISSALVAALLPALCATARADNYCVTPASSCSGGTFATLQQALDQAAAASGGDKIFLGAATYTAATNAGFHYNAAFPVSLQGVGAATTLTGPAGTSLVLNLTQPLAGAIDDLRIVLPDNAPAGAFGLKTRVDADQVTLEEAAGQANQHVLVQLDAGADFEEGTVTGDGSGAIDETGIIIHDTGSVVADTSVVA